MTLAEHLMKAQQRWPTFDVGHAFLARLNSGLVELAELEPRERNLLRQHYLDELSLEDLAALYRVHRATVARWLASARTNLLEKTREEIRVGLGLELGEVDSIVRLVNSRFDFSVGVFLSSVAPPP